MRRPVDLGLGAAPEARAHQRSERSRHRLGDEIGEDPQPADLRRRRQLPQRLHRQADQLLGPPHELRERPLQQLLVGRDPVGRPREWHAGGTGVGVGVEDRGEHERPGRAVDRGVVDLGELGDQAATVDTFDDVQLPQRASTIERAPVDAADRLAELLGSAGRRDRVVADVEVDVEVGILDPVRQVEPERNLDEAPPERRQLVDPFEDQLLHRLDTGPAGHPGRDRRC